MKELEQLESKHPLVWERIKQKQANGEELPTMEKLKQLESNHPSQDLRLVGTTNHC